MVAKQYPDVEVVEGTSRFIRSKALSIVPTRLQCTRGINGLSDFQILVYLCIVRHMRGVFFVIIMEYIKSLSA